MMDDTTAWDKAKAINQIKEKTESKDKPSASYKDGFMYYDKENADNFTAYKLPYVYVVDGKFKIVPKAIYAIAGAISGARGGLKIPDEDKKKIKSIINKYYEKLGKDSPFKDDGKCYIELDTFKCLEKIDIEKIFDEDIVLSNGVKKYIAENLGCQVKDNSEKKNDLLDSLRALNKIL